MERLFGRIKRFRQVFARFRETDTMFGTFVKTALATDKPSLPELALGESTRVDFRHLQYETPRVRISEGGQGGGS